MSLKKKTIIGLILLVMFGAVILSGCLNNPTVNDSNIPDNNGEGVISVATYYIEDFNEEKAANKEVMEILTKTLRNFDIIAVQGIDDPNGKAITSLINEINKGKDENGQPYNYQFNLSEPVGPANDKEQYAFIYNRSIVYPASIPRLCAEPTGDVFRWEPYMMSFKPYEGTGSVLFINIHTDANNTQKEIDELNTVIERTEVVYAGQLNMTILGNLNADEPYYNNQTTPSPLKTEDYVWATTDRCKSTLDGKAYDKIIVTEEIGHFLVGSKGVFNITKEYNLTQEQAEAVSSHYPVYAEYWRYAPRT